MMDLAGLLEYLTRLPRFGDPRVWQLERMNSGGISPHTLRLETPGGDLFIKATRDNESRTLRLLACLDLAVCPTIVLPDLLDQNWLVGEFVPGGPLRGKRLEPGLVAHYASMQNCLNRRQLFEGGEPFTRCKFITHDTGGFYRGLITRGLKEGYPTLVSLRAYGLPIVDEYIRIAERLAEHADSIAEAWATMPFAWLHHDFREAHIISSPQKLVDWGSSYGHGPFLFDLAPFLILDSAAFDVFMACSDICQQASRSQVMGWLSAATCAAFMAFILWRVKAFGAPGGNWNTPEECRRFLEYEVSPFRALFQLDVVPWRSRRAVRLHAA